MKLSSAFTTANASSFLLLTEPPQAKPDFQSVGGNLAVNLVAAACLGGESYC